MRVTAFLKVTLFPLLGVLFPVPGVAQSATDTDLNPRLALKAGWCVAAKKPINKIYCYSAAYFYRTSDNSINICSVLVSSPIGGDPAYPKVPTEIACSPLGPPPMRDFSMLSLGDRMMTGRGFHETGDYFSRYSWRTGIWFVSNRGDDLSFCSWEDAYKGPPKYNCTSNIVWNKYVPNLPIGDTFIPEFELGNTDVGGER